MTTLHLDFETRSAADLKKVGAYAYAEHETTDIICAAFALGDETPRLWLPGDPVPEDVKAHIRSGGTVTAHNANFERVIWRNVFAPRYGWPEPDLRQFRCTMAMAYALALPGGLDDCAAALAVPYRKDDRGYRVMLQVSKPRKRHDDGTFTWWDDEERLNTVYRYCQQDVVVERELEKRLMPLTPAEQEVWFLDQEVNDRGVFVDVDLCESAIEIAEQAKEMLDRKIKAATGGSVSRCTNTTQLREWLGERGYQTDSVAKEAVAALLARPDLPDDVQEALLLRQEGGKTSTAKADALLRRRQADGRARGLFQYHAASTGRWGGRGFQPQNLKRPDEDTDIGAAINLIRMRDLDTMLMVYDDPISVVGDVLRGFVSAPEGSILRSADFSNIEGRVLAWLAGEQWKLDAFAAYDRGEGEDLYKVTAGNILDKPAKDVTKPERQSIGKVSELALGYQGGVGAMVTMSGGRVDFAALFDDLCAKLPHHVESAAEAYDSRGKASGLAPRSWQAMEIIKLAWRATNSSIAQLWKDVEDAAIAAVADPGAILQIGKLRFRVSGSFLFMQLPSGRCLAYAYPRLADGETPWGKKIKKLKFMGVDSMSNKWVLQETYGGKLVENATQAVARDALVAGLLNLRSAGYPLTMHVHDEAVAETPIDFGSTSDFEAVMSKMPAWLDGCPVAASGWSAERYQK